MDITVKSTGFLIDELITARFKVEINPNQDNIQRMRLLDAATRIRLNGREDDIFLPVTKLQVVLRQCWNAQETIMKYAPIVGETFITGKHYTELFELGKAAIQAQKTNAERNKLIREIDTILGEDNVSVLGKTYA
jgi:hypothetical protein